uniref:PRA1 family protein n=1 Tax=Chenopodium quinoa TaxID=63459 RepID=A0A803N7U3_CHEQI
MANSNVTHRQVSTLGSAPTKETDDHEPKSSSSKPIFNINISISFSSAFNIPSTLEAAAARILRNLGTFLPFYVIFIGVVLLITLIPQRKFSLFLLLVNTNFTVLYLLLLRAFPSSLLLHKWIDKRLIFAALAVATIVEMIVTDAGLHLFFTLVGTIPVILIHAVLQATEGYSVIEDQVTGANDYIAETV